MRGNIYYLEDVSVQFGHITALKSVELSIEQGEVIFITGASGAGKSTLLKVLSGEIEPTGGSVKRAESDLKGKRIFSSRVFQELRLMERMSLEDNMKLSYDPTVYRSRNEFNQDMMELSKVLGIDDRLQLKARDANGGLRQKVSIVRALLARPDIFIADEPTSSLDFDNARKLFDLLNIYNVKRGMTIIWASHNGELVKKFSGRIVHLDKGRLVYSGHACFI
ncbi:MAG: ABC transporter ATP-binding protein [Bacteriovoracaceae bacterium]|nr:ABC transporter ATP-binding protein [Bacteriovoracaceae bacterium]